MQSVATEPSGQLVSTQDTPLGSTPQSGATTTNQDYSSSSPQIDEADTNLSSYSTRNEGQIKETNTFIPALTPPTPPSPPLPSTLSRRASLITEGTSEQTYGTQVQIGELTENKAQSAHLSSDGTDTSQLVPVRHPSQSQPNDQAQSATSSSVSLHTFTQLPHSPILANSAAPQEGHQLRSQYSQESYRVPTAQTPQIYPSPSSPRTPPESWNPNPPPSLTPQQHTTPLRQSAPPTPATYSGTPNRPNQNDLFQPHSWGPTQPSIPQSAPPQPFQPLRSQTFGSPFGPVSSRQPFSTTPHFPPTRTSSFSRYDSKTADQQTSRRANVYVASDPFQVSHGNDKVDAPSDGLTFDDIPTAGSAPVPSPQRVPPQPYSLPSRPGETPQQFIPPPLFYSSPIPQANQSIHAGTPQQFFPQLASPGFSNFPNTTTPQSHAGTPQQFFPQSAPPQFSGIPSAPTPLFQSGTSQPSNSLFGYVPFSNTTFIPPRPKKADAFVASDPFHASRDDDKVDAPSTFDDVPTVESTPGPRPMQGVVPSSFGAIPSQPTFGGYLPDTAPGAYGQSHNWTQPGIYPTSDGSQPWHQRPQPGVYPMSNVPVTSIPWGQSSWPPTRTHPTSFMPPLPEEDISEHRQPSPPPEPPIRRPSTPFIPPLSQDDSFKQEDPDSAQPPLPSTPHTQPKPPTSVSSPLVHFQAPVSPVPSSQHSPIFSRFTRFFRRPQRTHPLANPQAFTSLYPQPFTQPYTVIYPSMESEIDWHKVALKFLLVTFPKQMYLYFLLRLPSLYFSRVARIFEEADLSLPEIKKMVLVTASQGLTHEFEIQTAFESSTVPPAYKRLTSTWEYFIDSVMREWKILNIISVLLLSAILSILQIQSAAEDPVTRYTALFSLMCALISLLFGCMYIIRFGSMRRTYKAAEWALEAQKTKTLIWWNVWVLLAMPAIWLTWSIMLYIACIMSFVWRSGVTSTTPPGLSDTGLLVLRIFITVVLGMGVLYGFLIMTTFQRYGTVMDKAWKQRIDKWIKEEAEPFPQPPQDKPSYPFHWSYPNRATMYQPPTNNDPLYRPLFGDANGTYAPRTYAPSPYMNPKGSPRSTSNDTLTKANLMNNLSNLQDQDNMNSATYIPNPRATPAPLDPKEPLTGPPPQMMGGSPRRMGNIPLPQMGNIPPTIDGQKPSPRRGGAAPHSIFSGPDHGPWGGLPNFGQQQEPPSRAPPGPPTEVFDAMDPFMEGKDYGAVLDPFLIRVLGADVKLNPLISPLAEDGSDQIHLNWNMLFPTSTVQRSDDPPHVSWWKGRNAPATFPRISSLRLVSDTIPWVFQVEARDISLGITCGEVIDSIGRQLHKFSSKRKYDRLTSSLRREVYVAYRHNRSWDPGAPGGQLGQGLKRLDFLRLDTMFAGIEADDRVVKRVCGDVLLCTFVLKCSKTFPVARQEVEDQEARLHADSSSRPSSNTWVNVHPPTADSVDDDLHP